MDNQELIDFEEDIVKRYLNGELPYPIHLSGGNEDEIINVFKDVKKDDWIVTTYRSHYHALLKSGKKKWLLDKIKRGKSIHIYSKKYKIISSAIVGGQLSIAVGLAMAIKRKGKNEKVWCFCGDMAATTGQFWEAKEYSEINNLPIKFIIEDNGLSTDSPTDKAWGYIFHPEFDINSDMICYYNYERTKPHYGCGKFVEFKK